MRPWQHVVFLKELLVDNDKDVRLKTISEKYCKLLTCIDWDDDILVYGISEGLNKFLSNAYLKLCLQGDRRINIDSNYPFANKRGCPS